MTLNIQGSTMGYDVNGMQSLINDVYTNCVIPAGQSMRTNAQNTRYAIDQVWVGSSAEAFKEKLTNDTETLCKTLESVAEAIKNDMNNAGSNVEEYDEEIARALFASSGGGSTGTPQTAGTPNAGGAVNPTTGVTDVTNPQTPTTETNPAPDNQGIEGDGNPAAGPTTPATTPETPTNDPTQNQTDTEAEAQAKAEEEARIKAEEEAKAQAEAEAQARAEEEAKAKAEEEARIKAEEEAKAKAEEEARIKAEEEAKAKAEEEARIKAEEEAKAQAEAEAQAKAEEEAARKAEEEAQKETTDDNSMPGVPTDVQEKLADQKAKEESIKQSQENIEGLAEQIGEGKSMQCVELIKEQMQAKGLADADIGALGNGKDVASTLINNPDKVGEGHTVNSVTQSDLVSQMNNGQSMENLVISFNPKDGSNYTDPAGHVLFVSEVKDGNVYFIENFSPTWQHGVTQTTMTVEEFQNFYFARNDVAAIAQIS